MNAYSTPSPQFLEQQAEWLAPARARLLRRADIARRRCVLDLACGSGAVTEELARRCGGRVVAVDCNRRALQDHPQVFRGAAPICAAAPLLPFADGSFDLVFCQFALVWMDAAAAVREIHRILQPGGALAAIEPDYGGMIEHPPEIATRDLWLAALRRAGADPLVGRELPAWLHGAGFDVRVDLLDHLAPASPLRFDLLRGLPLSADEIAALQRAEAADAGVGESARVVHLPMFLILAERVGNA